MDGIQVDAGDRVTGGDTLLKLYDCANLWVHQCHIHHGNGAGIAANT